MERPYLGSQASRIAQALLVTGGTICFLVMICFIYQYHWTGSKEFSSPILGPLIYYWGPFIAGSLLLAATRLRPYNQVNLVLVLCSAGFAVYATECLFTIWFSLHSVQDAVRLRSVMHRAQELGIPFDSRPLYQVVEELWKQGADAVPSMFPQGLLKRQYDGTDKAKILRNGEELLPLGGVSRKLTVVCNEGGQYLTYMSDEHGFHNPPGIWDRPVDIVAVGDSYVQGWCVPSDRDFVSVVRRRYPATLSLGIEGDGPLIMLASIREYASVVKPNIVLWFYYEGNDIADLRGEMRSPLLRRYLTDSFSQNLMGRQEEINQALTAYIQEFMETDPLRIKLKEIRETVGEFDKISYRANSILRLSLLRERMGLIQGKLNVASVHPTTPSSQGRSSTANEVELLGKILTEARKSVESWHGQLYFVYLPSITRYDPAGQGPSPDRESVLKAAVASGTPVVDLADTFMEQPDPMALFPLRMTHHYNEQGHELVGETVLRRLDLTPLEGSVANSR